MTHEHGAPSSPTALRAPGAPAPSRRDPGRGGRSRHPAPARRAATSGTPEAAPAQVAVRTAARTTALPAVVPATAKPAPQAVRTTAPRTTTGKTARTRTPGRWAGIGIGLTVAVATTTALTTAAPQAAAPEADDRPSTGALDAITAAAAAAVDDRDGGASRGQARTAPGAAAGAKVSVAVDARMAVETLDGGKIDPAPPPPVLPGCDGEAAALGSNGQVPSSELCVLWDGHTLVRADAAVALAKLNKAYTAQFGESMCITDGYRSYSQQVSTKAAKGYLAATPGTSNHGWGLAVDICAESYSGARWDWLAANAPAFGWDNPDWARPGGSKYEPWHWEWMDAVAEMGGS